MVERTPPQAGDEMPPLAFEPLTRLTLALYCGASADHNPIHVDSDAARQAGLGDVIGHGMLSMAWVAMAVTAWVPQPCLRSMNARFVSFARIGDQLTCQGRVLERFTDPGGEPCARLALEAVDAQGGVKLTAEAVVVLSA